MRCSASRSPSRSRATSRKSFRGRAGLRAPPRLSERGTLVAITAVRRRSSAAGSTSVPPLLLVPSLAPPFRPRRSLRRTPPRRVRASTIFPRCVRKTAMCSAGPRARARLASAVQNVGLLADGEDPEHRERIGLADRRRECSLRRQSAGPRRMRMVFRRARTVDPRARGRPIGPRVGLFSHVVSHRDTEAGEPRPRHAQPNAGGRRAPPIRTPTSPRHGDPR